MRQLPNSKSLGIPVAAARSKQVQTTGQTITLAAFVFCAAPSTRRLGQKGLLQKTIKSARSLAIHGHCIHELAAAAKEEAIGRIPLLFGAHPNPIRPLQEILTSFHAGSARTLCITAGSLAQPIEDSTACLVLWRILKTGSAQPSKHQHHLRRCLECKLLLGRTQFSSERSRPCTFRSERLLGAFGTSDFFA